MDLWVQMWLWVLSAASYLNIGVHLEIVAVQKACGSIRYEVLVFEYCQRKVYTLWTSDIARWTASRAYHSGSPKKGGVKSSPVLFVVLSYLLPVWHVWSPQEIIFRTHMEPSENIRSF